MSKPFDVDNVWQDQKGSIGKRSQHERCSPINDYGTGKKKQKIIQESE